MKYWVVEFDGTEGWLSRTKEGASIYYTSLPDSISNVGICIGYELTRWSEINSEVDKRFNISRNVTVNGDVFFVDKAYTSLAAWKSHLADLKAAGTPLQVLYQLAEPIEIPYEEVLNLNLVDAKPYDLYTLDDIDGEPMYEVEVTPNADITYHTIVAPKAEWVDAHKQLPVTIGATLAGIGTNIGYDFIMNLEQRLRNLENK